MTCSTCRWWDAEGGVREFINVADVMCPCKANPPLLIGTEVAGRWPYTRGSDWCGKHARVPQPKAERVMVP